MGVIFAKFQDVTILSIVYYYPIHMKKMMVVCATTFTLGLLGLLFFTFGQISWNIYGIGFYENESLLLLAWIMLMFGTAFYYGLMNAILYTDAIKRRWEKGKWDEF